MAAHSWFAANVVCCNLCNEYVPQIVLRTSSARASVNFCAPRKHKCLLASKEQGRPQVTSPDTCSAHPTSDVAPQPAPSCCVHPSTCIAHMKAFHAKLALIPWKHLYQDTPALASLLQEVLAD
eukprot:1615047-Amphidinium_carterae.1